MGVENLSEGNGRNDASFIKNMFCDKVRTFIFQRFCGCNKKTNMLLNLAVQELNVIFDRHCSHAWLY